jgi:hypothetical protein
VVGHEHEHPGADEPTSQPDVVRPRVVAKRDRAGDVDFESWPRSVVSSGLMDASPSPTSRSTRSFRESC